MRALAVLAFAVAFPRAAALVVYYNVFSKSVVTASSSSRRRRSKRAWTRIGGASASTRAAS